MSAGSNSATANAIYETSSTVTSAPTFVTVPISPAGKPPDVGIRVTTTRELVLTVTGQIGPMYDIEATEDFAVWTVIGTVMLEASASLDFTD